MNTWVPIAAPAFDQAATNPIICPRMLVGKHSEAHSTTVLPGPTSPRVRKTPYLVNALLAVEICARQDMRQVVSRQQDSQHDKERENFLYRVDCSTKHESQDRLHTCYLSVTCYGSQSDTFWSDPENRGRGAVAGEGWYLPKPRAIVCLLPILSER